MFNRSFSSKNRAGKAVKAFKSVYSDHVKAKLQDSLDRPLSSSPIITMIVGWEQRLFAAHEHVLCRSPWFYAVLKEQFLINGANARQVNLSDEEPEILSCILEFLYNGDYFPRLQPGKRRKSWRLENVRDVYNNDGRGSSEPTIFHSAVGAEILRDTAVYCAAEKYGLEDLKCLALRKQGLQSGIPMDVILRSIRYTYEHTPDTDGQLRAHFLAMIIRTRDMFKRSGTMQMEMEAGGPMFFDLFVAMCNHMDDLEVGRNRAPKHPA